MTTQQTLSVMISEDELAARIKTLGAEIQAHYNGEPVAVIGVLKGCFFVPCRSVPSPPRRRHRRLLGLVQLQRHRIHRRGPTDLRLEGRHSRPTCAYRRRHRRYRADHAVPAQNAKDPRARQSGRVHTSGQTFPSQGTCSCRLLRILHTRSVRCRLRSRSRRALPQPSIHCGSALRLILHRGTNA